MRDFPSMGVRIPSSWAIEHDPFIIMQPEVSRPQRMLAGEDQTRWQSAGAQGSRDRLKLDGFWTSPKDNVDTLDRQPSP